MNKYQVFVEYKDKNVPITFYADNYKDAYFVAGQKIIEHYPDMSDSDCNLLSDADINNWIDICDEIYDNTKLDISDITEIDE